jgi:hypothetical protein
VFESDSFLVLTSQSHNGRIRCWPGTIPLTMACLNFVLPILRSKAWFGPANTEDPAPQEEAPREVKEAADEAPKAKKTKPELPPDSVLHACLFDARVTPEGTVVFPNVTRFDQFVRAYVSESSRNSAPAAQGWQCPCCKSVWAPSVTFCGCRAVKPAPVQPTPTTSPVVPPGTPIVTPMVPTTPYPAWPGPWTPTNPWYGTWSCSLQPSHLTTFSEDLNPDR